VPIVREGEEGQGEGPQMDLVLGLVPVIDLLGLLILPVDPMGPVTQWLGVKEEVVVLVTMEVMELVLGLPQVTETLLASMVVGFQVPEVVAVAVGKEVVPLMAVVPVPDQEKARVQVKYMAPVVEAPRMVGEVVVAQPVVVMVGMLVDMEVPPDLALARVANPRKYYVTE
jgi:hypothetical protein